VRPPAGRTALRRSVARSGAPAYSHHLVARVTADTVAHIARLAHLSLTADEQAKFAPQLEAVLSYAESLQGLDTADVDPLSHMTTNATLRDDAPDAGLERARALSAAPDSSDGLFRVPRVLGG
jgi:aspartyl-tRNA(Asn)/glutamyl-tRNA(Gln) amidotransferase subunit C